MERKARPWLIVAPLTLAAGQIAHAMGDLLPFGDPDSTGELLADPSTGSFLVAPLAAIAAGLVLVALAGHAYAPRPGAPAAWPFAALPVAVYLVQEHVEFALAIGHVSIDPLRELSLYAGLVLQLPLALGAYLLARLLLRVAAAIGERLRRRPMPAEPPPARPILPADRRGSARPAYLRQAPRGPPLPAWFS